MADLIVRLERAHLELRAMADRTTGVAVTRLQAKASGVALALSYAREYQRGAA